MRTEQLIADLASRAGPVRRLASPATRFGAWSGAAIASAALGLAVFGPRAGIAQLVTEAGFISAASFVLIIAGLAALTSLILAIPGAERSRVLRASAFTLVAVWGSLGVAGVVRAGGLSEASDWYVCFVRVIAVGLVPAWVLFGMLRRAVPLERGAASALAAVGAMAIGSCAMQFICPLDAPAHTFLGHVGPALMLCGAGALLSGALLRAAARVDRLD